MSDGGTFYFLCYPRGDRNCLTVIDLAHVVGYERGEWDAVTPDDFDDRNEAIRAARKLAQEHGKTYEMFESRYGAMNEYLGEFDG
jgi:hypothetical protein